MSWHGERRFLFLRCFVTPLSSRKLQLWEDQEIRDCFLSELASVFPKSASLSVLLHPQHRFGSLPRTSAVSAPGEPLSITRDHPKQPAASGAARGLRCVRLASGFKKEEVNVWKSSGTASPLLTPLAPRCPGATSISVPFFQSYLKANPVQELELLLLCVPNLVTLSLAWCYLLGGCCGVQSKDFMIFARMKS